VSPARANAFGPLRACAAVSLPILVLLRRAIRAPPELINFERVGAADVRGHDLAHVAGAFDLVVYVSGLQVEEAREDVAHGAGADAEAVGESRVYDLAQGEVRGRRERARVCAAEEFGEGTHARGVAGRAADALVGLGQFGESHVGLLPDIKVSKKSFGV